MFESETPGLVVYSGLISNCENRNFILCTQSNFKIKDLNLGHILQYAIWKKTVSSPSK